MEANYVHKDSTTLVQDELVKNELNQIELQYNALKQQKFNELLKENKKLKEKIKKLSQWDINKDTRNSRQRVANAKLLKENQELKQKYENAVADYETTMSELQELKKENKILRENAENNDKVVDKVNWENMLLKKENKQIKDKLSKIETLIINHNCDTGDIYYKYNSKFLKSELKQRILEIVYEEGSDNQ